MKMRERERERIENEVGEGRAEKEERGRRLRSVFTDGDTCTEKQGRSSFPLERSITRGDPLRARSISSVIIDSSRN